MSNYLAVFVGTRDNMTEWMAMPEADRKAKEREGIAAWKGWMEKHKNAVVEGGGPLGKTKRVSRQGIADASNGLSAFVVVRADSHDAAARMFEKHPHFMTFPGDGVEVMPVLPVPGG
jgi:hypothetical protein